MILPGRRLILITLIILVIITSASAVDMTNMMGTRVRNNSGLRKEYIGDIPAGIEVYHPSPALSSLGWMFRADPQHTGIYSDGGTRPNNILKWNVPVGTGDDGIVSSPAVADNMVYIGSGASSVLSAFYTSNGTKRWYHFTGARVESSPAVANGTVYAGSNDGNIYALNANTGTVKWIYPTNGSVTSSPAIFDGTVYVGSADHWLYAVFSGNHTLRWKFHAGDEIDSSPAVADGTVYVGSLDQNVYALSALNGTRFWTFPTSGWVLTAPSVVNGIVYVGSNYGILYAIHAGNGTERWHYLTGGAVTSTAVVNDTVYFGSLDNSIYAVNGKTGALRWSTLLGGPVSSSPAFAGGIIYVGCEDKRVYALNATTGDRVWRYSTQGLVTSSPAVSNGTVYVGCMDGRVYAIGNNSAPADVTPPMSVTGLHNTTYEPGFIRWTWTDPPDPDFAAVRVYLDGTFRNEVWKGIRQYNATGLAQNTQHTISTRTIDSSDNVNLSWVNHTARTAPRNPKTFYVRTGGGNSVQCDGLQNTDYNGTPGQCAFSHPFWALPPSGEPVFQGGDTMIIQRGTYRMGYGAPNTGLCNTGSPWDCRMQPVPSGSPARPTRILGEGWNTGCHNPPVLYGAERSQSVIDLTGSNYVGVSCLELTDKDQCVELSPVIPCKRDVSPYGNWAENGITGSDSGNVTLRDLNIHGLADRGIHVGRLSNWSVINTTIAFNGYVGWDGDIGRNSSDSGLMYFKNLNVSWNGCGETANHQPIGCNGQEGGGYGDGFGQGGYTGGDWVFEDTKFLHSTSDGLDLLYHNGTGNITLRRVWAEGNAGNQLKTRGTTSIENSVIIGNCGFFNNKSYTYYVDPTTPGVDACRAAGDAIYIDFLNGSKASIVNSEIYGEGNCLIVAGSELSPCNGQEQLVSRNNILIGGPHFSYSLENSTLFWTEGCNGLTLDNNYSVIFGVRPGIDNCPVGNHDICGDPRIGKTGPDLFSMKPPKGSNAIDHGLPVGTLVGVGMVPNHDIDGVVRPLGGGVDIGAYEFNATVSVPQADFTGTPTSGTVPLTVKFTDMSTGTPTSWSWSFGDGSPVNATKQNPVHTFIKAGNFTVNLTVKNAAGSSKKVRTAYIHVTPAKKVSMIGVFRPSTHMFYLRNGTKNTTINYGWSSTDIPVTGDWNGDGLWDVGMYRSLTHIFVLKNGSVNTTVNYGWSGTDIPVTGDWNGDGLWDVGMYRSLTHIFILRNGSVNTTVNYGWSGTDIPVTGDWNGDGMGDVGVYRSLTHIFVLKNGTINTTVNYGWSGTDIPVTGDWNGDGLWDVGVYRSLTHIFVLKNGTINTTVNYGLSTDKPVTGIWS